MLTPRLANCVECTSISALLEDIDCKITSMAKDMYNNTVFSLNRVIDREALMDLLNYKRILTYKFCNSDYAPNYTVGNIASRVKLLKFK